MENLCAVLMVATLLAAVEAHRFTERELALPHRFVLNANWRAH